jgi:signal transduction histidine kinase
MPEQHGGRLLDTWPLRSPTEIAAAVKGVRRLLAARGVTPAEQLRAAAVLEGLAGAPGGAVSEVSLVWSEPADGPAAYGLETPEPPCGAPSAPGRLADAQTVRTDPDGRRILRLSRTPDRTVGADGSVRPAPEAPDSAAAAAAILLEEIDRAAAQVQALRRGAAEADAARARLVGTLSHEIRNPLNALALLSSYLRRRGGGSDAELTRMFADISDASVALGELISDASDYFRLGCGREPLRPEPFEPAELLAKIAAEPPPAFGRSAVLQAPPPAADPTGPVWGDWHKARRVIEAMLVLAASGVEGGTVRLSMPPAADDEWTVEVSAPGPARSADQLAVLFEPYPPGSRRSGSALGLGPALAERIVHRMRGVLSAASPAAGGLTLTVRWARDLRQVVPADEIAAPLPRR